MTKNDSNFLRNLSGLLIPIVIALVGGLFTLWQHEAEMQKQYLDRVAILLEDLASENPKKRTLAIAYMTYLGENGQIDSSLSNSLAGQALQAVYEDTTYDPLTAQAVKNSFPDVYNSQTIDNTLLDTRVVLHIQNNKQRELAEQTKEVLNTKGYSVPQIVFVSKINLRKSQLRYFRDAEKQEAEDITNLLGDSLQLDLRINDLSEYYEKSTKIRPRTYEIWFRDPS